MAKVSPAVRSFNSGEFSPLVEGRTDIDRYDASLRKMINFVAAPQGALIRRSGTTFMGEGYDKTKKSALFPFIFSDEQALMIEGGDNRMRFWFDTGIQAYTDVHCDEITQLSPLKFKTNDLAADVGDQIAFSGWPSTYGVNGVVVKITGKVTAGGTDEYTVSGFTWPGVVGANGGTRRVARVYHISSPYDHTDVDRVRMAQSVDVVYLFCDGYRTRKLSRFGAYDWRLTELVYENGPFMSQTEKMGKLDPDISGNPLDTVGCVFTGASSSTTRTADKVITPNAYDFWESETKQRGTWQVQFPVGRKIDGYVIYVAHANGNASYGAVDYAPGDWDFEGSLNGINWTKLDRQRGYVLYEGGRSAFIEFENDIAYTYYRISIIKCTRNGDINPRIGKLIFADKKNVDITFTLSGDYENLNKGAGFLETDVDRLMRIKGQDGFWRVFRIKTWTNATHVVATLQDEPFPEAGKCFTWQIGYWSDGTGWPTCGAFFEDRLIVDGGAEQPDLFAMSRVGMYNDFGQRNPLNEVLDDSAVVAKLNSRKLSSIRWLAGDERGILLGTGTAEWVISPYDAREAISARNVKARTSTQRGSAKQDAVQVDRQVLYVQTSKRTVREHAYVYEVDGYKSPSMSLFASHIGVSKFEQAAYCNEPHSIVWYRRADGSVVGLTYQRDENVVGWHRHDFGGFIESIATIPSTADNADQLWLVIRRNIDGENVRYIERLERFWDFDSTIETAHFVDSGLRYEGVATRTIAGLQHLEGETVCGLKDGIPFDGMVVTDGRITFADKHENVVVGLQYVSLAEISRLEAGAADGTSIGKLKRLNNVSLMLWQSAYGEVGRPKSHRTKLVTGDNPNQYAWSDIHYDEDFDELQAIELQNVIVGPVNLERGYNKDGTVAFRQTKALPFNVVSIMPQLHVQDR